MFDYSERIFDKGWYGKGILVASFASFSFYSIFKWCWVTPPVLIMCSLNFTSSEWFSAPTCHTWEDIVGWVETYAENYWFGFFILVVLAHSELEGCIGNFLRLYHETLVACALNILTNFLYPESITSVQQCEASLEALHSLCLQNSFGEQILQNKELC